MSAEEPIGLPKVYSLQDTPAQYIESYLKRARGCRRSRQRPVTADNNWLMIKLATSTKPFSPSPSSASPQSANFSSATSNSDGSRALSLISIVRTFETCLLFFARSSAQGVSVNIGPYRPDWERVIGHRRHAYVEATDGAARVASFTHI